MISANVLSSASAIAAKLRCGRPSLLVPTFGSAGFEFVDHIVPSEPPAPVLRVPPFVRERAHQVVFEIESEERAPILFENESVRFRQFSQSRRATRKQLQLETSITLVTSRQHDIAEAGALYFASSRGATQADFRSAATDASFVLSEVAAASLKQAIDRLVQLPSQRDMLEIHDTVIPTRIAEAIRTVFGAHAVFYWQRAPMGALFNPRISVEDARPSLTERDRLVQHMTLNGAMVATRAEQMQIFPKKVRDWASSKKCRGAYIFPLIYGESLVGIFSAFFLTQSLSQRHLNAAHAAIFNLLYATIFDQFSQEHAKRAVVTLHDIAPLVFSGLVSSLKVHDAIGLLGDANIGLSLIERQLSGEALADGIKGIRKNVNAANENCRAVMKFTDFDRFEYKRLKFQPLIDRAVQQYAKTIQEAEIEVVRDFTRDGYVRGDADALEQVFANIISNSVYFLRQAPAADTTPRIAISLFQEKDHLVAFLRDNGPGIPRSEWERVFDFLHTTKGPDGTGVGLSMARLIVEHHGGSVVVVDSRGGGATIRVELPLQNS